MLCDAKYVRVSPAGLCPPVQDSPVRKQGKEGRRGNEGCGGKHENLLLSSAHRCNHIGMMHLCFRSVIADFAQRQLFGRWTHAFEPPGVNIVIFPPGGTHSEISP